MYMRKKSMFSRIGVWLIALNVSGSMLQAGSHSYEEAKMSKSHHHCKEVTLIYSKDVNHKGKGFVIREPGNYALAENITFKPHKHHHSVAIKIKSSDVTLDLGSFTLSQYVSKKQCSNAIGISAKNVTSIHINNGSVTDFTIAGIKIEKSEDIILNKLNILRTGLPSSFGGLQINDSRDILIDKVRALNNFGCGMYLHGVIKATVLNSSFSDNVGGNVAPAFFTGSGVVASGAYLDSTPDTESSDVLFEDCSFNRNFAGGDAGGLEIGPYTLLPVTNVTVLKCEFLENTTGDIPTFFNDASGLVLVGVSNYVIQDCIASGQRHPAVQGGLVEVSGATGFSINASNNGVIENCQAFDNVGLGSTSIGIRVRGCNNQLIKNCECSKNVNTGSGQAFGFYTDVDNSAFFPTLGNANVFESCVAQQNTSLTGLAGGFKIANLTCSTIENCISQENAIGILVTDSNVPKIALHNIFKENIVQCNTISGIEDQIPGSDNAYIENIARSNGPAGITNYVGLPAGTPIVVWSISGGFPVTLSDPFANLDIRP